MTHLEYSLEILDGLTADKAPRVAEQYSKLEGPEQYPFLNLAWLRAFEQSQTVFGRSGWIPQHIAIYSQDELVAFAPGYIKLHSFGEFVFDQVWAQCSEAQLGVPYYPKYIIAVPFTPTPGPRLLLSGGLTPQRYRDIFDLFSAAVMQLCEEMQLSSAHILFCDESLALEMRPRGWTERLGIQYQFHNAKLSNFDDFLSTFRAKMRANIRRERREVAGRGLKIDSRTGAQLTLDDAQLAYQLYLTTVDKYVWGKRYLNQEFFELIFRELPESIHFVTARDQHKKVVAGAFNLLGQDAIYGRYWGTFVNEPFLHFEVCLYSGIEETINRGLSHFLAGAGGEHKHGRGLVPSITRSLHYIREPRLSGLISDFCAREAEQVERATLGE